MVCMMSICLCMLWRVTSDTVELAYCDEVSVWTRVGCWLLDGCSTSAGGGSSTDDGGWKFWSVCITLSDTIFITWSQLSVSVIVSAPVRPSDLCASRKSTLKLSQVFSCASLSSHLLRTVLKLWHFWKWMYAILIFCVDVIGAPAMSAIAAKSSISTKMESTGSEGGSHYHLLDDSSLDAQNFAEDICFLFMFRSCFGDLKLC